MSFTGIMDHPVMNGNGYKEGAWFSKELSDKIVGGYSLKEVLRELKQVAKETNEEWSSKLGVNPSKQLSLVKPSGTVSQLCSTASGIHPRYAPYYIRRVRQDVKDPLTQFMMETGIPYVVSGEKAIFEFPIKSPDGAICARELGAMEQLELWKTYRRYWCEGNPSQTIYYTDNDFLTLQDWVWKNWDIVGGLSFFPLDDHVYENAPYEEIGKERYKEFLSTFPSDIDWSGLQLIELEDSTQEHTEFQCSGGQCEL